jgi:hypothetical protein
MIPEIPVAKPDVTRPEARSRALRDMAVQVGGVVGVAVVTWALDNAGLISAQLPIDEVTVVMLLTTVASMFGWRAIRKT